MEDKSYNYLWKIAQYIDNNNIKITEDNQDLDIIDKWIIAKCQKVQDNYINFISSNYLDEAKKELDDFLINDFCGIYKDLLDIKINEKRSIASENVFAIVFMKILEMYYEFIPEIVEFIYINLYSYTGKDLFEDDKLINYDINNDILNYFEDIKKIIIDVNEFREDVNILRKNAIDSITLNIKKNDVKLFSKSLDNILKLINAKNVNVLFGDETYIDLISNNKIIVKKR